MSAYYIYMLIFLCRAISYRLPVELDSTVSFNRSLFLLCKRAAGQDVPEGMMASSLLKRMRYMDVNEEENDPMRSLHCFKLVMRAQKRFRKLMRRKQEQQRRTSKVKA